MMLSQYGKIVNDAISGIPDHYENVVIDLYVIMSNHIHMILILHPIQDGRAMPATTVSRIVQHMKGMQQNKSAAMFGKNCSTITLYAIVNF